MRSGKARARTAPGDSAPSSATRPRPAAAGRCGPSRRREAAREAAGVLGFGAAVAPPALEPLGHVGAGAAEPAFDQQPCHLAAERRRAAPRRLDHHAGDARRRGDAGDGAPFRRGAGRRVERAEAFEQLLGLRHGRDGRRIEPAQRRRLRDAPGGEVEDEAAEVRVEHLGPAEGRQGAVGGLGPEAVAEAGARCDRRGRGAGRPRRATPARFRAASGRGRARSAAPARAPNPPPP